MFRSLWPAPVCRELHTVLSYPPARLSTVILSSRIALHVARVPTSQRRTRRETIWCRAYHSDHHAHARICTSCHRYYQHQPDTETKDDHAWCSIESVGSYLAVAVDRDGIGMEFASGFFERVLIGRFIAGFRSEADDLWQSLLTISFTRHPLPYFIHFDQNAGLTLGETIATVGLTITEIVNHKSMR